MSLYEREINDTLKRLDECTPPFLETGYFVRAVRNYFTLQKTRDAKPKVIVLGTSIPEEIMYTFDATPHWILGGSLGAAALADELEQINVR